MEVINSNKNMKHRPWSDGLPIEILSLFMNHLNFADAARFAAVCKPWRSAASESRHYQALQQPWQVLLEDNPTSEGDLHLFCPFEGRGLIHRLINLHLLHLYPPYFSAGWLMLLHDSIHGNHHLLNLFTRRKIQLPRRVVIDNNVANYGGFQISDNIDAHYFVRVRMSSTPSTENLARGDCIVATVLNTYGLAFCRPGDEEWSVPFPGDVFHDIIFFKGRLYCLNMFRRRIRAIEFAPHPKCVFEHRLKDLNGYQNSWSGLKSHSCFVKSANDELLFVVRRRRFATIQGDNRRLLRLTMGFLVYKLDTSLTRWMRMRSLGGNKVLIMGRRYGVYVEVESFSRFGFIRPDCIYFMDHEDGNYKWREFCFGDGEIQHIPQADFHFSNCDQFWFCFNV